VLRTRLRSVTWCLTQPGHARCIRAMSRSAAQRLLLVHRIHMYHVIRTHMSNKGSFITSCCSTTKTPTLSPGCACMKERGGGGVDTIVPVERERGTRRESERVREKARECERERERARESERERERARESERERERAREAVLQVLSKLFCAASRSRDRVCFFVLCKRHWINRVPGAHRGECFRDLAAGLVTR